MPRGKRNRQHGDRRDRHRLRDEIASYCLVSLVSGVAGRVVGDPLILIPEHKIYGSDPDCCYFIES